MHIQNHIRGYVLAQYGECELLHEFSNYSFFTQGFIANTFHVVNNEAWSNGKKSFLYFTDKLIDFAEAEEIEKGNEDGIDEIGFTDLKIAEKFEYGASKLWFLLQSNKDKLKCQFILN